MPYFFATQIVANPRCRCLPVEHLCRRKNILPNKFLAVYDEMPASNNGRSRNGDGDNAHPTSEFYVADALHYGAVVQTTAT
jgi:hypothetical protein